MTAPYRSFCLQHGNKSAMRSSQSRSLLYAFSQFLCKLEKAQSRDLCLLPGSDAEFSAPPFVPSTITTAATAATVARQALL